MARLSLVIVKGLQPPIAPQNFTQTTGRERMVFNKAYPNRLFALALFRGGRTPGCAAQNNSPPFLGGGACLALPLFVLPDSPLALGTGLRGCLVSQLTIAPCGYRANTGTLVKIDGR